MRLKWPHRYNGIYENECFGINVTFYRNGTTEHFAEVNMEGNDSHVKLTYFPW